MRIRAAWSIHCPRATKLLAVQPSFSEARANTLAERVIFELREDREQTSHRSTRRRRHVERFGERDEAPTEFSEFWERGDQVGQ